MKRRFFFFGKRQEPDGQHPDPHDPHAPKPPRQRRPVRVLPLLMMMIGTITVMVLIVRYALVPLLVTLGGIV